MTRACIAEATKLCESMDAFNHATHHHYVCVYSPSSLHFSSTLLRPQMSQTGTLNIKLECLIKSRSWFPSFQSGFTQNDSWMVIRYEGVPHVPRHLDIRATYEHAMFVNSHHSMRCRIVANDIMFLIKTMRVMFYDGFLKKLFVKLTGRNQKSTFYLVSWLHLL